MAASAPPPGCALDAPNTARAVRRSGRIVLLVLVVAVGILATASVMWWHDRAASELERTGQRTDGTVTEVQKQVFGRARNPTGSVVVSYRAGGETHSATIFVNQDIVDFHEQQSVTVAYDTGDPSRVVLVGVGPKRQGPPTALVAAIGLLVALCALHLFRRVHRLRRVLSRDPWLPVPARFTDVEVTLGGRRRIATLLWLAPQQGPAVRATTAGIDRVNLQFQPTAWTVGLGDEKFVAAAPGGAPIRWMKAVH